MRSEWVRRATIGALVASGMLVTGAVRAPARLAVLSVAILFGASPPDSVVTYNALAEGMTKGGLALRVGPPKAGDAGASWFVNAKLLKGRQTFRVDADVIAVETGKIVSRLRMEAPSEALADSSRALGERIARSVLE